jgi:hypothetical protein
LCHEEPASQATGCSICKFKQRLPSSCLYTAVSWPPAGPRGWAPWEGLHWPWWSSSSTCSYLYFSEWLKYVLEMQHPEVNRNCPEYLFWSLLEQNIMQHFGPTIPRGSWGENSGKGAYRAPRLLCNVGCVQTKHCLLLVAFLSLKGSSHHEFNPSGVPCCLSMSNKVVCFTCVCVLSHLSHSCTQ